MISIRFCNRLVKPYRARSIPLAFLSTEAAPAVVETTEAPHVKSSLLSSQSMTPKEVVSYLDDYIIGQKDAKKAVAVAFRNRWRRQHLPIDIKNEVCFVIILYICFQSVLNKNLIDNPEEYFDDWKYWLWEN